MKQAYFKYEIPNSKRVMYGSVTLTDKEKVSISLQQAQQYCAAHRYSAKCLANDIVAADFKHDAVTELLVEELSKELVIKLTEETQSLKKQYLELTEKYAKEYFKKCEKKKEWDDKKWYDAFGIEYNYISSTGFLSIRKYNRDYYNMNAARDSNFNIVKNGYDVFLKKELAKAEMHYEDSIIKLAQRISRVGLDYSKLEIKTSHVGVNIDMVLTDGTLSVKAWTIIASGPIQRPHYRYLVK